MIFSRVQLLFTVSAVLALALLGAVAGPAGSASAGEPETIHSLVNQSRAASGLAPVRRNSAMDQVAVNWANQMAANGAMTHNPNFSAQIPGGWTSAGENVAYGQANGAVLHTAWMNSPGHRANILGDYTDIGIAFVSAAGTTWGVEVFGKYAGAATIAAPAPAPAPRVAPPAPAAARTAAPAPATAAPASATAPVPVPVETVSATIPIPVRESVPDVRAAAPGRELVSHDVLSDEKALSATPAGAQRGHGQSSHQLVTHDLSVPQLTRAAFVPTGGTEAGLVGFALLVLLLGTIVGTRLRAVRRREKSAEIVR